MYQSGDSVHLSPLLRTKGTVTPKYIKWRFLSQIHFMNVLRGFKNYVPGSSWAPQHCCFLDRKCAVNHCTLLPHKRVLQLSLVTPVVWTAGSSALTQLRELQKVNTDISGMTTDRAGNDDLQLRLLSLLKKKKLIICSCQPWKPRPI